MVVQKFLYRWTLGFIFFTMLNTVGCATDPGLKNQVRNTSYKCEKLISLAKKSDTDHQLDIVTELFKDGCFLETVHLANYIRELRRDKFYSLTAEAAELFTPEGTFSPYILESYERSYLSLLISLSYLQLKSEDNAIAELRRSLLEENAILYNYGDDPVINLLQAALWDRFDTNFSRPLWLSISQNRVQPNELRFFATERIKEIDLNPEQKIFWRIYGVGQLPSLEWQSHFFSLEGKPYSFKSKEQYPTICSNRNTAIISTKSWTDKISERYNSSYHPILFAKAFLRLPFGVGYGVVGSGAGVAVGIGGCALAAKAESAGAPLCEASLMAAGEIIGASGRLVSYTMQPDLRHWRKVPMAFVVTRDSVIESKKCGGDVSQFAPRTTLVE